MYKGNAGKEYKKTRRTKRLEPQEETAKILDRGQLICVVGKALDLVVEGNNHDTEVVGAIVAAQAPL